MDSIPARLRSIRESRGLTLRALADAVGVQHSAISKWERGDNDVGLQHLHRWGEALGVHVDIVVSDDPLSGLQPDRLNSDQAALLKAIIRVLPTLSDRDARMLRRQVELLEEEAAER